MQRRALTGVLWDVGKDSMSMVGTDGHRLARISVPVEIDVDGKHSSIVPTKAINQIVRLAADAVEGGVQVKLASDHVIFRLDRTTLLTRLIEGPFPKYQDVIPKDNDKKVIVKRDVLGDALRRGPAYGRVDHVDESTPDEPLELGSGFDVRFGP